MTYLKLAVLVVALLGLAGENFWVYRKGQDSIIQNVIAGTATTIEKQDKQTDEAVKQATADATKITTLKKEADDLRKHLQAMAASNPRPECVMSPDELSAIQAAARSTKQ